MLDDIFKSAPYGVCAVDRDFNVVYTNPVLRKELGPVQGRKCYQYLNNYTEACASCHMEKLRLGEQVFQEYQDTTTGRGYQVIVAPLRDPNGSVCTLAILPEASGRGGEEGWLEGDTKFRLAFDTGGVGMAIVAPSGRFVAVNETICDMLGHTKEELRQKTYLDLTHPDDVSISKEMVTQLRSGARSRFHLEKRYISKRGREVWARTDVAVVRDTAGKVLYMVTQVKDITAVKRAEYALKKTAEALKKVRRESQEKTMALKQILDYLQDEREARKEEISAHIEQNIMSILEQMRQTATGSLARQVEELEVSLRAVLEGEMNSFRERLRKLTPRELEVCDLIKQGLSSKEIADRLNVSLVTIHKHREEIRKKLGIANTDINLSTYLRFQ